MRECCYKVKAEIWSQSIGNCRHWKYYEKRSLVHFLFYYGQEVFNKWDDGRRDEKLIWDKYAYYSLIER